jgi:CubicO group peptidase (beta-lactamase class C family)
MLAVRVKAYLDGLIAKGRSPGIQYMHVSADAVCCTHSAGMANVLDEVAVSERTTFNGYSVTKTFTAAAVLQLVEQGRVSLDAPIADYIERWPYDRSPTIRQTLIHTGGLPNPNPLSWCHLDSEHEAFDTTRFLSEVLKKETRLRTEPGTTYRYSNLGYLLLGRLIESVAGQSYAGFVQDHLIQPLRLGDSEALAFRVDHPRAHANGCVARWSLVNLVLGSFNDRDRFVEGRRGRWLQLRHLHVNGASYGGLIGNCRGFARYLQALLARSDYLSAVSRSLLFTRVLGKDGAHLPRSLGWFAGALDGEPCFTHPGGAAGYYCEIRVYPRIARGSVVMTNRTGIRYERLLDRIDGHIIADAC